MNKGYVPLSTIDDIKTVILDNMEKSSSNLLETAVIHERNNVRRECLDIIDKHLRKEKQNERTLIQPMDVHSLSKVRTDKESV